MKNEIVNLKDVLNEFKESEFKWGSGVNDDGSLRDGWSDFVINWWNSELEFCEDRNIVLEDLKKKKGYVYCLLVKWFNELEKSDNWECMLSCWEYSLEDLIRDSFDVDSKYSMYKLFSIEDINSMVYFKGD